MSVLSGLTQHHRMSLVHITHYNDEADAADRTVNLTGNGGAADNTEMVETAPAPAADGARRATTPTRRCSNSRTSSHEYGSGTPWATTRFARHQLRRPRGRRRADPRPQRVGQVDPGVDHGGADRADRRQLPARRHAGVRSGWRRGDLVPGGPAAADAQPRRSGNRLGGRVFAPRPRPGGARRWPPWAWIRRWRSDASISSAAARCAAWCSPGCWPAHRAR